MDVLSLNYTKTTRIRSGFITSVFWCSIFCFVVSTPSYIFFLVFMTLLVFDDLRFFFLFYLSLFCFFFFTEVTLKTRFGYGEETHHRFRSRSLSLVFGKEEQRQTKRGARARWHLHRRRRLGAEPGMRRVGGFSHADAHEDDGGGRCAR